MGIFFFLFSFFFLALQSSNCATLVVDGVTKWINPIANIGDTIMFNHKDHYKLYIFRTINAFNTCNFTQATHLSNSNSTIYTWQPSRPGYFYFSFNNGTNTPCKQGQKLAVKVNPHISPEISPAPVYPWPFQPRGSGEISPAPATEVMIPGKGGKIPFINSNPAVPLPTGEVDSASVGVLSKPVNHAAQKVKVVGLIKGLIFLSMFCNYVMAMI